MEKILVVGANGTTGKKIVNLLDKSHEFKPVAMVRKEEQVEQFKKDKVTTVLGDLEKDVSHTTNDIDRVIFAAGSGGKKVVEVDREGAKKMVDVSKENGIEKFIMLSSIGADHPEESEELQEYLEAKHNADEYLKNSDLTYTIVRPVSLTDNEGTGKIKASNSVDKSGSITRDDVAEALVATLPDDVAKNKTFEIIEGDSSIQKAVESMS